MFAGGLRGERHVNSYGDGVFTGPFIPFNLTEDSIPWLLPLILLEIKVTSP